MSSFAPLNIGHEILISKLIGKYGPKARFSDLSPEDQAQFKTSVDLHLQVAQKATKEALGRLIFGAIVGAIVIALSAYIIFF